MKRPHILESYGPLDTFLARRRYGVAVRKIDSAGKRGRILDIGCGSYPLFLTTLEFEQKHGLDQNISPEAIDRARDHGITLKNYRIEQGQRLPYEDEFFDVVTMLAVFEHIEPGELVRFHREIRRVLKTGGLYVMTTPAVWTDKLLRVLNALGLISDSIKEHKGSYARPEVLSVLAEAGFEPGRLAFGHFEMFMNSWATAVK